MHLAVTDDEIEACAPVMRVLRPHIAAGDFLARVRAQEREGYKLGYVTAGKQVVAVAGFRLGSNLAWGRFLYVDDLVTLPDARSRGHGARLLGALHQHARDLGCQELHLDSGLQRLDAHRFYQREGMTISCYHFETILAPP